MRLLKFVPENTNIHFLKWRLPFFMVSGLLVIASWVLIAVNGPTATTWVVALIILAINLVGVVNGIFAFAADFRERGRGHIVFALDATAIGADQFASALALDARVTIRAIHTLDGTEYYYD